MASDRMLRLSLRGNAVFSIASGAIAALFAEPLGLWMGIGAAWLVSLGASLALFAAMLLWLAARPSIPSGLAWGVVVADLAWVAGTVPIVMADLLTRPGDWVAIGIADIVLTFAVLQAVGIRRQGAVRGPERAPVGAR